MYVPSLEQERPIIIKPSTPDTDLEPERGRSLSRRSSRHSSVSSSGVLVAVNASPTNERRAPSKSASPPSYESPSLHWESGVASRSPSRSVSRLPIQTPPLAPVPVPMPPPHGFLDFEDLCVYPSQRSTKSRSRTPPRTPPMRVMTHSRHRRSSNSRSRSRSLSIISSGRIIIPPRSRSNSRSRPRLRRSPTRIIFKRSSSRNSGIVTAGEPRPQSRSRRTPPVVVAVPPSPPRVIVPRCASLSPPRSPHRVVLARARSRSSDRHRHLSMPPAQTPQVADQTEQYMTGRIDPQPPVITQRFQSRSPSRSGRGGDRNRSPSRPVVVVVQQPPCEPRRSPLQEFHPTISPQPSPRVVPAPVAGQTERYMAGRIGSPRSASSSPCGPPFWMGPEYAVRRRSPSASSKLDRGSVYYSEILPSRTETREPRHPRFWFEDGNLSFSVEGTQYNVHRYLFSDFDATFYQSHSKDALDRFLSVLYPDDYLSHECKTTSEWTSVLEIAHPRHPKVARLAIHQLSSSGEALSPVEKLRLAQKCGIDAWVAPAFHQLVLRTLRGEPLDVEEGRKVGVDVVVRIGMVVNAVMKDLGAYLDEEKVGGLVERQVAEMQVRK